MLLQEIKLIQNKNNLFILNQIEFYKMIFFFQRIDFLF